MDDWLAGVLEALERCGGLDETLVVGTPDPRENFGEGGLPAHAYSLDDRLTRVPFVAAGPGAPERMRSLAELPRVVAAAAELPADPPRERELPGAAVAQVGPPRSPAAPQLLEALERWGADAGGGARAVTPLTTASDGRYKL